LFDDFDNDEWDDNDGDDIWKRKMLRE
jgi:hypothetical protein